jgi:Transposase DDE domain
MREIEILYPDMEKVLESLNHGQVDSIEEAVDQITDEFMIYGLRGGLMDKLSKSFPDPRREEEISTKVILTASMAGHFQDMYAMSQSPYALHSPTLLAELGLNVKVLSPGEGISRRGTKEEAPFSGDVIRKMLDMVSPGDLISWYNKVVGKAYLGLIDYRPSFHILDCTDLDVKLENENYEGSGIVRRKKKVNGKEIEEVKRGYKLGSLRSLLDDGGIITGIAFGAIQVHDLELCRELLKTSPMLKHGDTLLVDMAFIDGEMISDLKKRRGVDVVIPLRSDMLAYADSLVTAYHPSSGVWESHPTREGQQLKHIEHVEWMWENCSVGLNGCVVRYLKDGKDGSGGQNDYEHNVFVSTDLSLKGKKILKTYDLRSEIEEDHRQWKDGLWEMTEFTSRDIVQILYHVICVLLSHNLQQVYTNTETGQRFSEKTLRYLRRKQIRNHEVSMIVYSGDAYAVLNIKILVGYLLRLPKDIQIHLYKLFPSGVG